MGDLASLDALLHPLDVPLNGIQGSVIEIDRKPGRLGIAHAFDAAGADAIVEEGDRQPAFIFFAFEKNLMPAFYRIGET